MSGLSVSRMYLKKIYDFMVMCQLQNNYKIKLCKLMFILMLPITVFSTL